MYGLPHFGKFMLYHGFMAYGRGFLNLTGCVIARYNFCVDAFAGVQIELAQGAETLKKLRADGINKSRSKKQGELSGEEIFQYGRRMHS